MRMITADEAAALKEEIKDLAEDLMIGHLKNPHEISLNNMRNNIEWVLSQINHTFFKFLLDGQDEPN